MPFQGSYMPTCNSWFVTLFGTQAQFWLDTLLRAAMTHKVTAEIESRTADYESITLPLSQRLNRLNFYFHIIHQNVDF